MAKTLINKGFNGWSQLGVFLGMWGIGLIAGSLAAVGIWKAMTGLPLESMVTDMHNPAHANAIKMVQAASTLFMFCLPVLLYAFICYRNGWLALGFNGGMQLKTLALVALILLAASPLIDSLTTINKAIPLSKGMRAWADNMEATYEKQVSAITGFKHVGDYLLSLFMIAILPAVFEELLFRGGLQNMLHRWWQRPWLALVVTSIIFSAIHGSWYGFLPRIALGMVLGTVFLYTQNIWYCIVVHLLNNALVVTYMYYRSINHLPMPTSTEATFPWWAGLLSLGVLVVLFRVLLRQPQSPRPNEVVLDRFNPFDPNRNLTTTND